MVKKLKEEEMARELFEIVDRLVERLEGRQVIDNTHEVLNVTEDTEDGNKIYRVLYQPARTRAKSDRVEVILDAAAYADRVKKDHRQKVFQDSSVAGLFDALDHADNMLNDLSIGDGEMAKAFDRIRGMIRGQTADSLPKALRGNEAYRQSMKDRLEKVGEFIIGSVVAPPRRVVLRKQQRQRRKQD